MKEYHRIPLFDILKYMDLRQQNYILENLNNFRYGSLQQPFEETEGLFPFLKNKENGSFTYLILPRLETNIMEEESLMQTFDKMIWVDKIIKAMDEVAENAPVASEYKDKD